MPDTTPIHRARSLVSPSALLIAAGLVLIGLVHFAVGDLTWWGESISVWPTVGWLMLVAPRLALWTHRGQWRDVAVVGGAVAVLILTTTEWRGLFRGTGDLTVARPRNAFRVVTWNVAGGMPLADLAADAPDIALLQEIGAMPKGPERNPYFQEFQWLADFDPGTLSRNPIERLPTKKIGPWQEPQVLRTSIAGRKLILVNVRLTLPAFVVAVASLETPSRLIEMHAERLGQFGLLRDLVRKTLQEEGTSSAVLCGDFNSPGGIQSGRPLRTILRDVWPEGGRGWSATMPAWLPMSRIDQCWVTPDLEILGAVVRKGTSDHRRLVVDLAFR